MLYVSFLVASLNAPVYVAIPVRDADVVDEFLGQLDRLLPELARRPERAGGSTSTSISTAPRWRATTSGCAATTFSSARSSGDCSSPALATACISPASRSFWRIWPSEEKQRVASAATSERDGGPTAHAMVRVRPENWKEVLSTFRLGWAEASRQSCLNNLSPLSSVARAAAASGERPASAAEVGREADSLYGVHFFCPDGGRYELSANGSEMACSVHGSALAPRQMAAPAANSPAGRLIEDFGGLTAALTFLEDGLHAVVTIQRK